MKKLSKSAYDKYTSCPEMHRLHYVEKIRPILTGSALVFGSAMDTALNSLLEKSSEDPWTVFDQAWNTTLIGKNVEFIRESTNILWDASDFDPLMLTEGELDFVLEYMQGLGYGGTDAVGTIEGIFKKIGRNGTKFNELSENQKKSLSFACHLSMTKKAHLMIDTYINEALPTIEKVLSVQETVELDNVMGVLDIKAIVDGKETVVDNKTAKTPYGAYQLEESIQIPLYNKLTNTDNGLYIVLNKKIIHNKRGKRCNIQILPFTTTKEQQNLVFDSMKEVATHIKNGVYYKNLNSCAKYYGAPCPYYNYCRNGDMAGLYTKEEK